MEHAEESTPASVEEAGRELRLAQQSFFKDVLGGVRGRYRRLLIWTVVGFVAAGLVWTFLACPLVHHRIGWCPMGHVAAR